MTHIAQMSDYYREFPAQVRDYARWYNAGQLEHTLKWRGVPAIKFPSDMWVYQELIAEIRPTSIVEFGTKHGGSALFFADMLELLQVEDGKVLTVDIDPSTYQAGEHPRITQVFGDSICPGVEREVRSFCTSPGPVLLIEDSQHKHRHVHDELELYHDLVTPGSYFVVEDGAMGDVEGAEPSGVALACFEFLRDHPAFTVDWSRNRFGHTSIHGGFLQRTA